MKPALTHQTCIHDKSDRMYYVLIVLMFLSKNLKEFTLKKGYTSSTQRELRNILRLFRKQGVEYKYHQRISTLIFRG